MRILGVANGSSQVGWIGMGVTAPKSALDVSGNYAGKNVITIQNSSTTGFSSVDMLDNAGNLAATFGFANSGTGTSFTGKAYLNGYGNDFLFTRGSSFDLIMKGNNGYIGLNTSTPSERLHVVGNFYLTGAFMPNGNAGSSGYILTSAGANTSPTWTNPNSLAWRLTGNSGTSAATNFIGTSDAVDFVTRTNNTERLRITSAGNVGIGLSNPSYALSVLSASNPLYLSGVQATSTFTTDSVLTINAGVVKKTPYSSLTDNFWSITGNSGTNYATNFLGTLDNVSLRFRTSNTERMIIDSLGRVGIGASSFNTLNPAKLLVDYGSTTSNTLVNLKGTVDDYFQVNLQNRSSSIYASSDYVATADDGTDSTYYVDLGINSSTYAPSVDNWGGPHDAYLYSNSRHLLVGTQASNSDVIFLVGGGRSKTNTAMRIEGSTSNIIIGTGNNQANATGNIIRGPNGGNGTNIPGGSLTLQGGSSNGNTAGGNLNLYGGGTVSGTRGSVNINVNTNSATNINTGTSASDVIIGNALNNINLPKLSASSVVLTDASKNLTSTTPSANTFLYYNGTNFIWQSTLPSMWSLTGNSGTTPGTNFIGTTDNKDLVFKTNGTEAFRATSTNRIGIGTITPSYILSLNGDANQTFGMERSTTTNGSDLTIQSGSSKAAVGNKLGGDLYLNSGIATGTGSSNIYLQTSTSGSAGNADNPLTTKMTILGSGNVGIGNTNPSNKLSVIASSDPLYLSGVQATAAFATDSLLTIYNGVVKKSPYSSLPGGSNWSLTGNSGTNGTVNFLGTTDAQPLVIKSLNRQLAYFDGNLYSIALGITGLLTEVQITTLRIGYNATTNNQYTLALGYGATATGVRSIAIGNGAPSTIASGAEAVAIGYNAISSNVQSTAIGYQATASGSYGVALGYSALASASQSTAIGYSSLASAQYANAIGYQAQATGLQSTAIGYRAQTAQSNTILLGDVATTNLHVGIGTAAPTAKLDIVGTAGNNPLEMQGVPAGVFGTDNFLTINASGVVGYVTPASLGTNYWSLSGNAAASGNFLGTTNTTPLEFKFNSTLPDTLMQIILHLAQALLLQITLLL